MKHFVGSSVRTFLYVWECMLRTSMTVKNKYANY